jgi:hypothetical protein
MTRKIYLSFSIADELRKLAVLRSEEILTEKEFGNQTRTNQKSE